MSKTGNYEVCVVSSELSFPHSSLLSPFAVQEVEPEDCGPVPGEVSSWDVNTERPTSTVAKLCKTESQNHMSPRYSADVHI